MLFGAVGQVVNGIRQSLTKRTLPGPKRKMIHGVADDLYRNCLPMRDDEYLASGRLPMARSRARARTSSKTAWSAPACGGSSRWLRRSFNSELSIFQDTSMLNGNSTSNGTSTVYTHSGLLFQK
jgi:hypothetical protein